MTDIVAKDRVVKIAYTLRSSDGEVLDEATEDDALYYLHGHQNLLPKFEENLEGATPGDARSFVLSPEEGYGEKLEDPTQRIDRDMLQGDFEPEVGMEIVADFGDGPRVFEIQTVTRDYIEIDLNHPMAGEELHFEVKVLAIRDAHPSELEHGHAHGGGHHHHH